MIRPSCRRMQVFASFAVGLLAVGAPMLPAVSHAQSPASHAAEENHYIAVVRGGGVYIRSGAGESYYAFGRLEEGAMVKVVGERTGWARIATVGPAFRDMFGFIKHAKGDSSRLRITADGTAAITLGKVDIVAPNMDARYDPKESWKSLVRLEPDQQLHVIETTTDGDQTIHRVVLPESAIGWVSMANLERASAAQAQQFATLLAQKPQQPLAKPASQATPPSNAIANRSPEPPTTNTGLRANDAAQTPVPPVTDADRQAIAAVSDPESELSPNADVATAGPTTKADEAVPAAPVAVPQPAAKPKLPTLDDLEAALKLLQKESMVTAEVQPLRDLYLDLARRSADDARVQRYATGRAEQLQLWLEVQEKRAELDAIAARMKMSADEAEAVRLSLERSAEYIAVGRIIASTIYDGQSLPKLFRLQDPGTGRTVAYLKPDQDFQVVMRIDTIVGIVGEKEYDETLRLNVIHPKRIDVLTPQSKATAVYTESQETSQ